MASCRHGAGVWTRSRPGWIWGVVGGSGLAAQVSCLLHPPNCTLSDISWSHSSKEKTAQQRPGRTLRVLTRHGDSSGCSE